LGAWVTLGVKPAAKAAKTIRKTIERAEKVHGKDGWTNFINDTCHVDEWHFDISQAFDLFDQGEDTKIVASMGTRMADIIPESGPGQRCRDGSYRERLRFKTCSEGRIATMACDTTCILVDLGNKHALLDTARLPLFRSFTHQFSVHFPADEVSRDNFQRVSKSALTSKTTQPTTSFVPWSLTYCLSRDTIIPPLGIFSGLTIDNRR
jgi:hypothetical protein